MKRRTFFASWAMGAGLRHRARLIAAITGVSALAWPTVAGGLPFQRLTISSSTCLARSVRAEESTSKVTSPDSEATVVWPSEE